MFERLKFQQKRRNGSDRSLPSVWRRTWDSNPRGCYTLLDFQSSSLATRSILQVCAAQRHLYYYSISGPALQAKFRQSCIFSFRKAVFFFTVFCRLLFQAFHSVFTLYEWTTHCLKPMGFLLQFSLGKMRRREKFHLHACIQDQHILWHRQNTIGHKQIACRTADIEDLDRIQIPPVLLRYIS